MMRTLEISAVLSVGLLFLPHTAISQESPAATPNAATSKPSPDAAGVYRAGHGGVSMPKLVYSVEPAFTDKARKKKINGNCKVWLVVDIDGHVKDVRVIHSVAEDQPAKLKADALALDEKAIEAVRQYRFEPALLQGKPVPVALTVEVNFTIF
jgi:TonB family protein